MRNRIKIADEFIGTFQNPQCTTLLYRQSLHLTSNRKSVCGPLCRLTETSLPHDSLRERNNKHRIDTSCSCYGDQPHHRRHWSPNDLTKAQLLSRPTAVKYDDGSYATAAFHDRSHYHNELDIPPVALCPLSAA